METTNASAELGRRGEDLALEFLQDLGYRLIERNWRASSGEIDLVMREGDELVFVEVKTRFGEGAGRAEDAVSRSKVRKLLNTCEWYAMQHPDLADLFWRWDLIAITFSRNEKPELAHFVNAIVIG
jgi:putative endonuclease